MTARRREPQSVAKLLTLAPPTPSKHGGGGGLIVKISRIITVCFCNKLIIVYFITLRGRRGECNKTGVTRTQFLLINVTIASF